MKDQIEGILNTYVDTYGFVSLHEYVNKRNALKKSDRYHQVSFDDSMRTILTLGLAYPSKVVPYKGKGYGILSRYSYGVDYHLVFKRQLELIVKDLKELGIKAIADVDSMKIDERFASSLAKMGFLGKNQFLIHPTYGTYLYLATVLIDQEIPPTETHLDACGTCHICVDFCPTNALDGGFHMNRCLSYTTQAKIPFDDAMRSPLKKMVYGCDVCQVVCPKNKGIDVHLHQEFEPDGLEQVDLLALLQMTNREYKEIYKNNASSWKGLLVMKRNAICLLEQQKIKAAIPIIEEQINKHQDVEWFVKTAKASLQQLKRVD